MNINGHEPARPGSIRPRTIHEVLFLDALNEKTSSAFRAIAFVFLLLPLVLRESAPSPVDDFRA